MLLQYLLLCCCVRTALQQRVAASTYGKLHQSTCLPRWKAASSRTGQAPTADEKFERVDVLAPVISAACCTPRQHALLGL
jgi:hypothetical protein